MTRRGAASWVLLLLALVATFLINPPHAESKTRPSPKKAQSMAYEIVTTSADSSFQSGWMKPYTFDAEGREIYVMLFPTAPGATTHKVRVGRYDPSTSEAEWFTLPDSPGGQDFIGTNDIGHCQPSVAVDGEGKIHVMTSMHRNVMREWISVEPGSLEMAPVGDLFPANPNDRWTYPVLTAAPDGSLWLFVRHSLSGTDSGNEGLLYQYTPGAGWQLRTTVAFELGFSAYPDDLLIDSSGHVHLIWEWAYGTADQLRHLGSYAVWRPETSTLHSADGTELIGPATTTSPVVFQPLYGSETKVMRGGSNPGFQVAKLALSASGAPKISYRKKDTVGGRWMVKTAEWIGSAWSRQVVYAGAYSTTAAVDISVHPDGRVRVYYAKAGITGSEAARLHSGSRPATGSVWTESAFLPGDRIERFSVIRRGDTDYAFVISPTVRTVAVDTFPW